MSTVKRTLLAGVSLVTLLALLAACGATPAPVEEKIQVVKETVVVAGTSQVVEKEVTKVVQETVEKVVTPTPPPPPPPPPVGVLAGPDPPRLFYTNTSPHKPTNDSMTRSSL